MSVHDGGPLPWLMIIDMQRVFGESGSPWFTPGFDEALAAASRLRSAFGRRVALTRFVPPAEIQGAWVPYYRRWPFALDPANAHLFDLVPGCPAEDAVLIDRPTFGKWDAAVRRDLDATLVLAGVSTDCCVLSTALAAVDAGMTIRVAADACAGTTAASHRRALDAMALYAPNIEITTVDAILAEHEEHRHRVAVGDIRA